MESELLTKTAQLTATIALLQHKERGLTTIIASRWSTSEDRAEALADLAKLRRNRKLLCALVSRGSFDTSRDQNYAFLCNHTWSTVGTKLNH